MECVYVCVYVCVCVCMCVCMHVCVQVMFAPSRRVYDTFGAELPPHESHPTSHGLHKTYKSSSSSSASRPQERSQHVPYYSVPSNV